MTRLATSRVTRQDVAVDLGSALADSVEAALRQGELDSAIHRLADVPARNGEWMLYRAWLERQRGLYTTSVATIDAHLAAAGESAPALLQRGHSCWLAGDLDAAAAALQDAAAHAGGDHALRERIDTDIKAVTAHRNELEGIAVQARRLEIASEVTLGGIAVTLAAALVASARRR